MNRPDRQIRPHRRRGDDGWRADGREGAVGQPFLRDEWVDDG